MTLVASDGTATLVPASCDADTATIVLAGKAPYYLVVESLGDERYPCVNTAPRSDVYELDAIELVP